MSDYNFLMESRLSPEQHRVLGLISRVAAEQGLNLYLVGGAVRDLTYGQQVVRDLDLAVEGNPERILRRLDAGGPARRSRQERGLLEGEATPPTVEYQRSDTRRSSADLRFSGGVCAELAMCRQEIYPKPTQRSAVHPATIFDDLKRRDFSANAMAVSLHPNSRGLLLDPTNGAADIERRELRVLHSRSFLEDASRIYRLLRLGLRLGFKPEEKTKLHIDSALEQRVWERLEPDQQGRELRAILQEENPGRVFKMLAERKLLAGLDKKVAASRIPYDRFAKIRSVCRGVSGADPWLLNFHCLVERFPASQKTRLARKIVVEPKAIKTALSFERDAKKLARVLGSAKSKLPSQIYALLSTQPLTLLLYLLATSPRAVIQKRVRNYLFKYSQARARVLRAELQGLGVKPGREFEKIIERIFAEQLDGKIKTHQQLLKRLRALAGIKEPAPKTAAKLHPAPAHPGKAEKKAAGGIALAPLAGAHAAKKSKARTLPGDASAVPAASPRNVRAKWAAAAEAHPAKAAPQGREAAPGAAPTAPPKTAKPEKPLARAKPVKQKAAGSIAAKPTKK
jgi:tRNA nucleotidyltransferase/poly(A) polymerase